jgi:para-aminobenzoate synthetase/4-amino-4-deoxychorismate lyase
MQRESQQTRPGAGTVLLQRREGGGSRWLRFAGPVRELVARTPEEVRPVLEEVRAATARGLHAAGYLTYEAAAAFDRACAVRPPRELPPAWFGLYAEATPVAAPRTAAPPPRLEWRPAWGREAYRARVSRVREAIAAGDTYQVNLTFPWRADCRVDAYVLFAALLQSQPHGYAAYLDLGEHVLCSVSPELFFAMDGSVITCRPMKGTVRRGATTTEDARRARWLEQSAKNRAENVMIVDMIRHDLGRIAETGSVCVERLFAIERYRTLFQMTSTVTARTHASFPEVMAALFPCASITGAPKYRTMEIIRELEPAPRGIYTGCIGSVHPGGEALFNVAIRTLHVNRRRGTAIYGTGGGIVWDSDADDEYRECQTKALVLRDPPPPVLLLETLRWEPAYGYLFLREHLDRMQDAALYFDFPFVRRAVLAALVRAVPEHLRSGACRVRLVSDPDGALRTEVERLDDPFADRPEEAPRTWRVQRAPWPVDMRDRFLYHKTTRREVYESARAACPGADDVLLGNTRGEVTESTIGNVAVRTAAGWVTPPTRCGLLAGVYRGRLLAEGRLREQILRWEDLARAEAVCILNSVRGWIPVRMARSAEGGVREGVGEGEGEGLCCGNGA